YCFLLLRRTPSSTLFPYTTLFRSGEGAGAGASGDAVASGTGEVGATAVGLGPVAADEIGAGVGAGCRQIQLHGVAGIVAHGARADRKSTRLNSSHLVISYAVFCLK